MDEVAPVSVHTAAFININSTLFGFILGINLAVFFQLMCSVGELAFLSIGTATVLDKLFAELALFLVLILVIMKVIMI